MIIILLTLFVLFARVAEAQDYLPMLTDGKEWHCMEDVKYSQRDGKFPLTIKVVKDTIVGDQTYKLTSKTAAIDGIQMDAQQNGKVYDLSGRMVSGKRKGVYIQNGRKYVSHP